MKTLFLLLLLVASAFSQSSDTSEVNSYFRYCVQGKVKFDYQNWKLEKHTMPAGIYYQFEGRTEYIEGKKYINNGWGISHPEMILGFLIAKGVSIKEAWYQAYQSSCGMMQVIVPGWFTIRTEKEMPDEIMNALGFTKKIAKTEQPVHDDCSTSVQHYVFEN